MSKQSIELEILLQDIQYADDAELLAAAEKEEDAVKDMQFMVNVLNKVTSVYGQAISIKKTEIMRVKDDERILVRVGPANRNRVPITIAGQELRRLLNSSMWEGQKIMKRLCVVNLKSGNKEWGWIVNTKRECSVTRTCI